MNGDSGEFTVAIPFCQWRIDYKLMGQSFRCESLAKSLAFFVEIG